MIAGEVQCTTPYLFDRMSKVLWRVQLVHVYNFSDISLIREESHGKSEKSQSPSGNWAFHWCWTTTELVVLAAGHSQLPNISWAFCFIFHFCTCITPHSSHKSTPMYKLAPLSCLITIVTPAHTKAYHLKCCPAETLTAADKFPAVSCFSVACQDSIADVVWKSETCMVWPGSERTEPSHDYLSQLLISCLPKEDAVTKKHQHNDVAMWIFMIDLRCSLSYKVCMCKLLAHVHVEKHVSTFLIWPLNWFLPYGWLGAQLVLILAQRSSFDTLPFIVSHAIVHSLHLRAVCRGLPLIVQLLPSAFLHSGCVLY